MKKLVLLLLLSTASLSFMYSQKRVQSNEIFLSEAQRNTVRNAIDEFKTIEIDLQQFKRDISSARETRVLWSIDETITYDMRIYPHDIRATTYKEVVVSDKGTEVREKGETITYKGELPNGKRVRLTVDNDFIYGGIETETGYMMIKQLKYVLKDAQIPDNRLVIYRTDRLKDLGGICNTPDTDSKEDSSESGIARSSSSGCKIIEVALDCDTEYYNEFNSHPFGQMLGEINMIQDVYEDDLDAILNVTDMRAFIGSMYTSTSGNGIINEIDNLWSSSLYSGIKRDLVHHFTGKGLNGLLGQASGIGEVCVDSNPVCFTADTFNGFYTVAHEIGHLLNGIHSNGVNCGSSATRSIMCQGEVNQQFFSSASITRITNFMSNKTCINFNTVSISGDDNMCLNNTRTYTLTNFVGTDDTNITWSTNSRLSIQSGQGTESVVVRGSGNGNGVLTAVLDYPGTCGNVTETKNILVGPPLMTISLIGPDSSGWVTATANGGSSPYTWTLNNTTTWTTTSATTTRYVGCSGGYLYVQASNNCGQGSGSTFVPPCSGGGGYYTTVYPNPSDTEITVEKNRQHAGYRASEASFENPVTLRLYDFGATMVKSQTYKESSVQLRLDVGDLKKGNYFLKITGKGIDETHQVIIE